MNAVLYSWLAAAAVSPFVAIISCWTLAIFRSYRSEWRLLDIFLFALTTLEGVSALFSFGYSILAVIRPALEAPCRFLVWGNTASRAFHLSAVTSLLLDRALSTKWSESYRSSVRQSQVRYHIVVLAIISVFVGVTSVFARLPSPSGSCSLHPLEWDPKFSAFLNCVYGFLLFMGMASCLTVQLSRFQSTSKGTYRTTCSRDSGSSSGTSCGEDCPRDLEWRVVVSICLLSYAVNHVPYVVLNSFAMAEPSFWSQWIDNCVIWLQLVQGILVPCVLLLADLPHRCALRNMLRQPGRIYRHLSDQGGFRIQIGDTSGSSSKPNFPPFPMYRGHVFPQRLRWSPTNLPSLQSLQPLDIDSLQKMSYGSGGYTTLLSLPSSTTTSFSSPYSSCCSSVSQSVNSVTTNAVDDFVFRRPSVLALFDPQPKMRTETAPEDRGYPEDSRGGRRCDTPTPFVEEEDSCSCKSSEEDEDSQSSRDIISQNMINIILSYEMKQSSTQEEASETDVSSSHCPEESLGDLSSVTSSESSDADSVQSVIIRQRVDQRGRVSESDITIAQRKVIRCDKDSECESLDSSSSDKRILYSEYL